MRFSRLGAARPVFLGNASRGLRRREITVVVSVVKARLLR